MSFDENKPAAGEGNDARAAHRRFSGRTIHGSALADVMALTTRASSGERRPAIRRRQVRLWDFWPA